MCEFAYIVFAGKPLTVGAVVTPGIRTDERRVLDDAAYLYACGVRVHCVSWRSFDRSGRFERIDWLVGEEA